MDTKKNSGEASQNQTNPFSSVDSCIADNEDDLSRSAGPNTITGLMIGLVTVVCLIPVLAHASELDIPHQFSAGYPAIAEEVNANFAAAADAVNDNNTEIAALLAIIETLQNQVAELQTADTELSNQLDTLVDTDIAYLINELDALAETDFGDFTLNVMPYLSGGLDAQNNPTIFFSGVNVHINNGDASQSTETINGTGNLIIGFDEPAQTDFNEFCSGVPGQSYPYLNENDCENVEAGGTWNLYSQKTGSHNLVIGPEHSYISHSGLISGYKNVVTARYSAALGANNDAINYSSIVSGGNSNVANGVYSSISGGVINKATGYGSIVSGGYSNVASGVYSSISGGIINKATGYGSSVSGGSVNRASGGTSSINGGTTNRASGNYSSVSAGNENTASGIASSVSGGIENTASGVYSSVSGGIKNAASGVASSVSGGAARTATENNHWVGGSILEPN